jgi:hypothetical protein
MSMTLGRGTKRMRKFTCNNGNAANFSPAAAFTCRGERRTEEDRDNPTTLLVVYPLTLWNEATNKRKKIHEEIHMGQGKHHKFFTCGGLNRFNGNDRSDGRRDRQQSGEEKKREERKRGQKDTQRGRQRGWVLQFSS